MARAWILLLAATTLVLLPLASAQTVDPVLEKAERDVGELQSDPAGFVGSRASPAGVQREAEWAQGYACDSLDDASDSAGAPLPDVGLCPRDPDVAAVPDEPDEPVAIVEPLEPQSVVDAAVALVEEIRDDPRNALDHLSAFLAFLVAYVMDLLGGIISGILGLAGSVVGGLGAILDEIGLAFHVAADAGASIAEAPLDVVDHGVASIADVAAGVGDAAADLGHAVAQAADGIHDAIADLLGGDKPVADPSAPLDDVGEGLPEGDLVDLPIDVLEKADV